MFQTCFTYSTYDRLPLIDQSTSGALFASAGQRQGFDSDLPRLPAYFTSVFVTRIKIRACGTFPFAFGYFSWIFRIFSGCFNFVWSMPVVVKRNHKSSFQTLVYRVGRSMRLIRMGRMICGIICKKN